MSTYICSYRERRIVTLKASQGTENELSMITTNAINTSVKHSTLQSLIWRSGHWSMYENINISEFIPAVILIQYDIILLFKNVIIWIPVQLRPSPTYLLLHWQSYEPAVLVHVARAWHVWSPWEHSSMSEIIKIFMFQYLFCTLSHHLDFQNILVCTQISKTLIDFSFNKYYYSKPTEVSQT